MSTLAVYLLITLPAVPVAVAVALIIWGFGRHPSHWH